ncbi:FixH family protein [Bacillus sp. DJP31]|uniref:FixH family protein n=1 Tax=Bacillus sp. DJP31 TaxID=3409789 RepID=UPI003BB7BDC7
MKNIRRVSFGLIFVLLVGCNDVNGDSIDTVMPAILEVLIQTSSENPVVGEEVLIEAIVTQAGEAVDDANDVSFEVWEANSDDHEMIVGEHGTKGVYFTSKVFETGGEYNVVAHVTARDQHTMPKIELIVGAATEDTAQEHSNQEHDHEKRKLSIDVKLPEVVVANELLPIEVIVLHEEKPLLDAQVKFEIWGENESRHVFIDAKEKSDGNYAASFEVKQSGKHHIVVHIQNDTLHEHIEREVVIGQ